MLHLSWGAAAWLWGAGGEGRRVVVGKGLRRRGFGAVGDVVALVGAGVDVDGLLATGVKVASGRLLWTRWLIVTWFWDGVRLTELQVLVLWAKLSSPRKRLLRSYLSSIVSPQRSVSPIQGSKLPMMAGMSATLYPIMVFAT